MSSGTGVGWYKAGGYLGGDYPKDVESAKGCFFVALFLSLRMDSWSEPPPPSAGKPYTQPQTNTSQDKDRPSNYIAASESAVPTIENIKPSTLPEPPKEKDEKTRDYSSSEWWLVYLTAALAAITGILAWYTASLYKATVALGREAKTSGDISSEKMERYVSATIDANQLSSKAIDQQRQHTEIDLRAWIGFYGISFDANGGRGSIDNYAVKINWKNYGSTPALNASVVLDREEGNIFTDKSSGFYNPSAKFPVAPTGIFSSNIIIFTPEDIVSMKTIPVIVRSVVKYDCIFPEFINRISECKWKFEFVGRHSLNEVRTVGVSLDNFVIRTLSTENQMT